MTALSPLRRDLLLVYLATGAVAAHLLEATLPGLGPWFKPGLANIFPLIAFIRLGFGAALAVSLLRVLSGSLILGTFLSPTFILSFSGAMAAMAALAAGGLLRPHLGPVGLSLLMALLHMSAQVAVAAWLLMGHGGILTALPWFLLGAWVTGVANGFIAAWILARLERHWWILTHWRSS